MSSTPTKSELDAVMPSKRAGENGNAKELEASSVYFKVKMPKQIVKRDGRIVVFDLDRIEQALAKCFVSEGIVPSTPVEELTHQVGNVVAAKYDLPTVEGVQDIVEMVLQAAGEYEAAKHYILYRAEHAKMRVARPVPDDVRDAFAQSEQYFPTQLQKFQFYDKYSRFNYDLGRRETWLETVNRAVEFLKELSEFRLPAETYERVRLGILNMKVMPSMRLLAMAGPAARRNNVAIYNCSYMPVDSIDSFVEALIISMSGCGVGYSVERRYIEQFPRIARQSGKPPATFVVPDSSEGWADAVRAGLTAWFNGEDMLFDYSEVRPAGAALRVKGGRASGPEPLRQMLDFARTRVLSRQGGFLRSLDGHDLMCAVGDAAVSGGVRRTAMISLFDYDDQEMLHCKDGDFWHKNGQRWNANNSAVWPERELSQTEVTRFLLDMVESGNGEPGIFNRRAAINGRPERRKAAEFGTNPCVTADTWVAVADGRGRVQMKELVAEEADVDVLTVKDGQLVVRTMRNPRKTGTDSPIYRVTFSDGTSMRVTPNHKFVLVDGTVKQAVELEPNDALTSLKVYSYRKQGLPQTEKVSYDEEKSYRMLQFGQYRKSEHRFIYQHDTGQTLDGIDYHLHHVDFDGRNNHLSNLELVSAEEHALIHRERMLGANNPVHQMTPQWRAALSEATTGLINGNAKEISNEELHQRIAEFIQTLGYVPTIKQYQKFAKQNGLPMTFSGYRQGYFGSHVSFALQTIAAECGIELTAQEARLRAQTDLPVVTINGLAHVLKDCEVCGQEFAVRFNRREQACCGHSCSMVLQHRQDVAGERLQAIHQAHDKNRAELRTYQVKVYNDLTYGLGRHPLKVEWQAQCKEENISPEISRESSPFRYWNDLQETAVATNHRVVSVEPDGYEDVYTGTVDDTHTYFAIGQEAVDSRGRVEMRYVLNVQCGEIILRPYQFCNLTSAVARADDTLETLSEKVELAAIVGSIQGMATHFPGLRPQWKQNCVEERLLGVDLNGQMDSPAAQEPEIQSALRKVVVETNRKMAALLDINQSAATTCVKPSGNSSQLLNSSSGLHARWAPYYVRNIRVSTHTPVYKVLRDAGVPMDPENGQTRETATTWVIHFPVKAPETAVTRNSRTALQQCEYWLQNKVNYTEHNPSVTITYNDGEVLDLIKWIWVHQEKIGGMAFLPSYDAQYDQMPYAEIGKEEYAQLAENFPVIDFSKIYRYEENDLTTAAQELACMAGGCDII